LIDAIDRARIKLHFHVWAYVIMPEHAHLLVWPTEVIYNVSDILNSIKQSVSKRALNYVRRNAREFLRHIEDRQPNGVCHYRFWQRGGGYDRNVVEATTLYYQIDYFHNNPVRRGLCEKPDDWRWSSAAQYADLASGPLRLDRDSLPVLVVS
jgi:putative transposase